MKEKKIYFILIQIDEAHSTGWNVGLDDLVEPQKNIGERLERANKLAQTSPFDVYVDTWVNDFGEIYHAWPDKYYCFDRNMTILQQSEYGSSGKSNAKIVLDCVDLITSLLS